MESEGVRSHFPFKLKSSTLRSWWSRLLLPRQLAVALDDLLDRGGVVQRAQVT